MPRKKKFSFTISSKKFLFARFQLLHFRKAAKIETDKKNFRRMSEDFFFVSINNRMCRIFISLRRFDLNGLSHSVDDFDLFSRFFKTSS